MGNDLDDFFARDLPRPCFHLIEQLRNKFLFSRKRGLFFIVVTQPVDAAARAVYAVVVMAFPDIRPIDDHHAPIGSLCKIESAKPKVLPECHVFTVFRCKTCPVFLNAIAIDATSMKVDGERITSIFLRPLIGLVNHQTAVCVSTSSFVGPAARWPFSRLSPIFFRRVPVHMVGDLWKQFIGERIGVLAIHAL